VILVHGAIVALITLALSLIILGVEAVASFVRTHDGGVK
jgi:hypothetical protein